MFKPALREGNNVIILRIILYKLLMLFFKTSLNQINQKKTSAHDNKYSIISESWVCCHSWCLDALCVGISCPLLLKSETTSGSEEAIFILTHYNKHVHCNAACVTMLQVCHTDIFDQLHNMSMCVCSVGCLFYWLRPKW